MKLSDFTYTLPPEKIAKVPVEPRDSSKLLIVNKSTGELIDDHFYNLDKYLNAGDIIVRNNTKVIPARIFGTKETGGKVEILLTKKIAQDEKTETWECLTKPGLKPNQVVHFGLGNESPTPRKQQNSQEKNQEILLSAQCVSQNIESYTRVLEFNQMGPQLVETLEKIGITPLPPYIADETSDSSEIREKYQTVYAKHDGSAAAPTAGLHFTENLEEKLIKKGIRIAEVTLHVGLGTFLPVKTDSVLDHHMHSEWFEVTPETAEQINTTKKAGGKIICVGTTSSRVLESASKCEHNKKKCKKENYFIEAQKNDTEIFMYPGYEFKMVDALITNFHLPESTLLMLVSSLVTKPNTDQKFTNFLNCSIGKAYLHAIENEYRFYSFGDAMLII